MFVAVYVTLALPPRKVHWAGIVKSGWPEGFVSVVKTLMFRFVLFCFFRSNWIHINARVSQTRVMRKICEWKTEFVFIVKIKLYNDVPLVCGQSRMWWDKFPTNDKPGECGRGPMAGWHANKEFVSARAECQLVKDGVRSWEAVRLPINQMSGVFFPSLLSSLSKEHVRPARCLSRLEAGEGPSKGGKVRGRFSRGKWPTCWLRGCYSLGWAAQTGPASAALHKAPSVCCLPRRNLPPPPLLLLQLRLQLHRWIRRAWCRWVRIFFSSLEGMFF